MRTEYISSLKVVSDYLLKSGKLHANDPDFNEDLARIYSDEAIDELMTADSYKIYIGHHTLYNGKTKLYPNFKYPLQVAYRGIDHTGMNDDNSYYKTTVAQYVQRSLEDSCNLTVDVSCPKCHKTDDCSCESYPMKLDVTHTLLASNPELSVGYTKFLVGYSNQGKSSMNEGFKVIYPASNYYHSVPNDIRGCMIPDLNDDLTYSVDNKVLTTNSIDNDSQVLISYLGSRMDDDGWLLIPNEPFVFKAVTARIMEGFALYEYNSRPTQSSKDLWITMNAYASREISKAKSKLRIPDPDQWRDMLDRTWLRRLPNRDSTRSNEYFPDEYQPGRHTLGNQF